MIQKHQNMEDTPGLWAMVAQLVPFHPKLEVLTPMLRSLVKFHVVDLQFFLGGDYFS